MRRASEAAGASVIGALFHRLAPQGVSGVVVLEESHFSLHTWPEFGYAAVDLFTCGDCRPDEAHHVLTDTLQAERAEVMILTRGGRPPQPAIRVVGHETRRSDRPGTTDDASVLQPHDEP